MNIHLTRLRTPLIGAIQVAGTYGGIVRIQLDEDTERMREALLRTYPEASFKRPSAMTVEAGRVIRAYLGGGPDPGAVPVVLPEAGFSARVWRYLRRIPFGQVRTYGAVARGIRRPRAVRAVGQSCGLNPVPLVVP